MSCRLLLVPVFALALAAPALCQSSPAWVPLVVGVPVGKPAEITLVTDGSNSQATMFDVRIFGFWKQDITAPTGDVYQRIEVPGLRPYGKTGAPELPVARTRLAIPTSTDEVKLAFAQELAVANVANYRIYPQPLPGEDEDPDPTGDPGPGDTVGTEEQFFPPDPVIYALASNWPAAPDTGSYPTGPFFDVFTDVSPQVHPVRWNPTTKNLKVITHLRVVYVHGGTLVPKTNVAKPKLKLAQNQFLNWPVVQSNWGFDFLDYDARYLIITRDPFLEALAPLIHLKKIQGFQVVVVSQWDAWDFDDVVDEIADFYDGTAFEHYCLLVGETDDIPVGHLDFPVEDTTIDIPTDDLYGSFGAMTTDETVFVGRLSADSAIDLENQVAKIVGYQVSPAPLGAYDRAVLVAHIEGAPGKYQGAHNQVTGASYSHPPIFETAYGASGDSNSSVKNEINLGAGVVAYRGHGSTNAWTNWNLIPGQDFHKNDVLALANSFTHPVVWAITCTNANLEWSVATNDDSIAEAWMEANDIGGVASYGATITTSTNPNHVLDKALFKAVYDAGVTTHAQAIALAEEVVAAEYPGNKNPWAYLLLGDPAMKIRRDKPLSFGVSVPTSLPLCTGDCNDSLMIAATTDSGAPAAGALISLWKPSLIPGQPDEVFVNAWANGAGVVNLIAAPLTPGTLHVCVQDDDGNLTQKTVQITMDPVWTDLGHGLAGTLGTPSLVGLGPLTPGSTVASLLTGVVPDTQATLVVGLTAITAPFKGGVFVPFPDIVVAGLSTGPLGSIHLPTTWPSGVPAGFSFFLQYWMHDSAGPQGFAASNAVRGTTP
jgi:hypothetical protein